MEMILFYTDDKRNRAGRPLDDFSGEAHARARSGDGEGVGVDVEDNAVVNGDGVARNADEGCGVSGVECRSAQLAAPGAGRDSGGAHSDATFRSVRWQQGGRCHGTASLTRLSRQMKAVAAKGHAIQGILGERGEVVLRWQGQVAQAQSQVMAQELALRMQAAALARLVEEVEASEATSAEEEMARAASAASGRMEGELSEGREEVGCAGAGGGWGKVDNFFHSSSACDRGCGGGGAAHGGRQSGARTAHVRRAHEAAVTRWY